MPRSDKWEFNLSQGLENGSTPCEQPRPAHFCRLPSTSLPPLHRKEGLVKRPAPSTLALSLSQHSFSLEVFAGVLDHGEVEMEALVPRGLPWFNV